MSETTTPVLSVDIPSGWHVELGDQYHTGLSVISYLMYYRIKCIQCISGTYM